jgi:hypothetical protein
MKSVKEIKEISNTRLQEAKILHANKYFDGAFYLAGYAVELVLKAKICELLDIPNLYDESFQKSSKDLFKSYRTHKLDNLILLAGLRTKFEEAKANDVSLQQNWNFLAERWSEQCRYFCCGSIKEKESETLINSIENKKNGILTWILKI